MDRKTLEVVAHHEAGHAVVGFQLGFRLQKVTIRPEGDTEGHTRHAWRSKFHPATSGDEKHRMQFEDAVVIAFAGPLAEERFVGKPDLLHASGDYVDAMGFVQRFELDQRVCTAWLKYLEERARFFVWRHWQGWPQIKAVAAALLEHQTLKPKEAAQVIQSVEGDEAIARQLLEEGDRGNDDANTLYG